MANVIDTLPMAEIAELCRRYHVAELALFGSALRDDLRPDSDLDFLVEFERNARVSLFEFIGLQEELAALVGRSVDLAFKDGLKPVVREQVLGSARVVFT
jgi:uncharacterized protein